MEPQFSNSLRLPGAANLRWLGLWLPVFAFIGLYGLSEGLIHLLDLSEAMDVVADVLAVGAIVVGAYCGSASIAKSAQRLEEEARLQKHQALAGLERRFQLLYETSSDGVLLVSADGICRYASPSIRRLLGYAPEGLLGRGGFEAVHPEDRETAMDRFAESLRHPGQPIRAEFRIRHQDGSWRWIDSMFRNLLADPSVQAVVSNYRDVTDRKEAEEAQGRARVELELRYRWAKEEFGTSQEQLRASAGRLLAFHEGERARLAREIHEDLGQMLAALKLESAYLASGSPEDEASRLEAARTMSELAVSAIHSVRRIATDLRPSILDHLGLVAALKWQAEEFEHRTDIACEFVQGQAEIPLATEARTTVFRIFQETMSNIARHAHATRVRIHLREEAGNLWLTVADNGRGIAEQEIARLTSLGLFGMREQAHLLGGQVSIVGQAGEGTTVTLQIPLGRANSVELSEEPP